MGWREICSGITRREKLVLAVLTVQYKTPGPWPPTAKLASECLMSERDLLRVIASLTKKGLLWE
jgi:hypothetical protein